MQETLFELQRTEEISKTAEWGTFKDSLKAPVHRWFTYPAGFSHKAVEHSLRRSNIVIGEGVVYDPFMGSGTTNIVAKALGYNSYGMEAHPFVFNITKSKLEWEISISQIESALLGIEQYVKSQTLPSDLLGYLNKEFPELILKCFLPETLFELSNIRNAINSLHFTENIKTFLRTALICALRKVSIAATGWPYIAPNKVKITSYSKKGWNTFKDQVLMMGYDLVEMRRNSSPIATFHNIYNGDSRDTSALIPSNSADHIFTSPPYLNNFDYADRTRLEMYFMGDAKNWGDISGQIRTKLMTSATTQISRMNPRYALDSRFELLCPEVYTFLIDSIRQLAILRNEKSGKKSYDLLVAGYFNDMLDILIDNLRILKDNSSAIYILGDSAPYGVHIPTDELIGKIGLAIGFKNYKITVIRTRGGKWANNPQRHTVALRESIVELTN